MPTSEASRYRLTIPSQTTGTEMAKSEPVVTNRSSRARRLTAAIVPIAVPARSHRIAAPTVSEIVAGSRLKIRAPTAT